MQVKTKQINSVSKITQRRTFAIISHPDAGKTTLTEKMLLYSGAINLAGNVRARKNQRSTTSDWMEIEKTRGISIASSVLQFIYANHVVNLLDTPGHDDFSEDTYRTLSAVDSAVMVLDAAKGIEEQTKKLFEVCRLRGIPIFTFINKMDRPSKAPLALLDEIQEVLQMEPVPLTWPVGSGHQFMGVYDRAAEEVILFERSVRNEQQAAEKRISHDEFIAKLGDGEAHPQIETALADIELLDGLGIELSPAKVLAQSQTPVFFGSALTSFGVGSFLTRFLELSPGPQPYRDEDGLRISPDDADFSGFVFKIQANLDPRHRDSVAFLRICSGTYERGMSVVHEPTGREVRLPTVFKTFAQDREVVEQAYPGDIIAIPNNGSFKIGDTFYAGASKKFKGIPRFSPERFAVIQIADISKHKQFDKGLAQLATEGAIQVFYNVHTSRREPILAAVGNLQFEVVQARLKNEYGVETTLAHNDFQHARWVVEDGGVDIKGLSQHNRLVAQDHKGDPVLLFQSRFALEHFETRNPEIKLAAIAE